MQLPSHSVQIENFEGPLDLLLHLIKQDEMEITEISVSRITEQYSEYLSTLEQLNIELASEFVVMASHLLYLKSRSILPHYSSPPELAQTTPSPKWDLIQQLLEYKKFKEASDALSEQQQIKAQSKPITVSKDPINRTQDPIYNLKLVDLVTAFQNCLAKLESKEPESEAPINVLERERLSVREKIEELKNLPAHNEYPLEELFERAVSRHEMIVIFLALLELIKQTLAVARQGAQCSTIHLRILHPSH